MTDLPVWIQIVAAVLLVVGGVFALVGAVGLLRFPDFYMRLHAPTKATTLGVGGVLVASMVLSWTRGEVGLHELLITLFLFVTAPVSANLLSQAALHGRVPSKAPVPADVPVAEARDGTGPSGSSSATS
ncbi:Na+/H+ antiporter subunit G [Rubrivivax albus]|uniref:Na+/H+ antiporter subunit G n=1 Tax=Rubrivivax albus TaxID=2499835 RepID=UPI0018EEA0B2|nr:Na+/H+ antiporter subunit G [Rubrivivax albus]